MLTRKEWIRKNFKRVCRLLDGTPGKGGPVFIFGEQRSGTNMLVNTLDRSRHTECFHETDQEAFDNCVLKARADIGKLVKRSRARKVIFKSIDDCQNAARILDEHDGALGLWIFRRYTDVVNSSLRAFKEHYRYLHYILFEPEIAAWRGENITAENMELIRHYYDKKISDASSRALIWYLRNYQYFQQGLDSDSRVLPVNYERLVENGGEGFRDVFEFLDLPFGRKLSGKVFTSSVGKRPPPDVDPEIEELCGRMHGRLEAAVETRNLRAS